MAKRLESRGPARLDLVIHANGRREEVVTTLRREVADFNRSRGGGTRVPLELVTSDPRSPAENGDSHLLRVSIAPASGAADTTGGSGLASRELFINLDGHRQSPQDAGIAEAAALLGTEAVSCTSIDEVAAIVRNRIETDIAEAELEATPRSKCPRLGWPWYAAGLALLSLCPGPWLRHFGVDFQIPPFDWRVLAPRHIEYVPIWVPPTIGIALLAFLGFTLWRLRRIRLRLAAGGDAEGDRPPGSRTAPLVAVLLLAPFLTNAFFTELFFRDGRIIDTDTEAIHSEGLGMLTTYYPLSEFDRERDQFRFARPKYHLSPNILPFWQPWGFAMVFVGSVAGMTMLAVPWRRRLLLGGMIRFEGSTTGTPRIRGDESLGCRPR